MAKSRERGSGGRRTPEARGPTAGRAPAPAPPIPARHPAMVSALAIAGLSVLATVTFHLYETDFWHHLLVGRVIWETRSVPAQQLWSWPAWGAPEANSAWLFRALVWPLWSLGETSGLFAWRWLTTLAAFGVLWATARRMGARGFAPLVALVLCAFIYRLRSQIRPETLVAVLIAVQLWILETRRRGGPDRSLGLIAVAWVWANTHLSYYLGFVILAVYLAEDWIAARRGGRLRRGAAAGPDPGRASAQTGRSGPGSEPPGAGTRRLALVGLAALAVSFVNPFGWQALWQPFDFALHLRGELIYRTILELKPVDWRRYVHTVLPLLVGAWMLLIAWRAARGRFDRVEALLGLAFTALALSTQRFLGVWAVVAAPFLMRGLGEWVDARRWPAWSRPPWTRAALAGCVCLAAGLLEWRRPDLPFGVGIRWEKYPVRACDFMAANGVRGRGFNNFELGGYQAWRFWPDRERLPFMTATLEAATPVDRLLYAGVFARPDAWRALDRRHRFDYVLLTRVQEGDNRLLDVLDADTTWALVFADDAATVYVRRGGPLEAVASRHGGRLVPAGAAGIHALGARMAGDPALVPRVESELRERVAASPWSARDLVLLADLALTGGRAAEARDLARRALRVAPGLERGHALLGLIALAEGRGREAVAEFERERARFPGARGIALHLGQAWQRLGDLPRARRWYRMELRLDPGNHEALDSLEVIRRRLGE